MKFIVTMFLILMSPVSYADDYLKTIGDFTLPTITGKEIILSEHTEELVAIYIQGNGCPIARLGSHDFKEVVASFSNKPIAFYMMNSFIQDTVETITKENAAFEFGVPIMKDSTQQIAKTLGVERTADVFVLRSETGEVVYRGPINDKLGYETQKVGVTENYLIDGLNTVLSGGVVDHTNIPESKGCLVALF
jgi:peroxiredoxin